MAGVPGPHEGGGKGSVLCAAAPSPVVRRPRPSPGRLLRFEADAASRLCRSRRIAPLFRCRRSKSLEESLPNGVRGVFHSSPTHGHSRCILPDRRSPRGDRAAGGPPKPTHSGEPMRGVTMRGLGFAIAACLIAAGFGSATMVRAEEEAPALPAYMSATSPDAEKPLWPDPTGANAGFWTTPSPGPVGDDDPSKLSSAQLYDRIAHNLYSINFVWTLVAGFLVMFMQAGFMFVETGLCRAKNAAPTSSMNFMIYPLGCLGFWAYGFAIGWGNWWNGPVPPGWYASLGPGLSVLNSGVGLGAAVDAAGNATGAYTYGLMGTKGFFLNPAVNDVGVMAIFFFMMVFMDTTATIPTGVMAERWSWKSFCLYGLWVALPYCLYANWVWGGGWLAQGGVNWGLGHGAVDFAGSGVVHGMGGIIGLAGAMVLGQRIGKYVNGKPQAFPGHNIPFVVLGTFILAFGWFGFNPG